MKSVVSTNMPVDEIDEDFDPQFITFEMRTWGHIHRNAPDHYISNIDIDILYGDDQEKIGEGKAFEVRMDHLVNDGTCSLFDVFDCYADDLFSLYEELFEDEELKSSVDDEVSGFGNVIIIKSIVLRPEYRGKGLGGILALAVAEHFDEQDIVALKPWPLNPGYRERSGGKWGLPPLTKKQQKVIAKKLRQSYMSAGFQPLFRGSAHLFLTHYRHPSATELIDRWNEEHQTS